MSQDCNENCSSCSETCSERKAAPDFREKPHELSSIKKVIAVISGKGGVGKSLVTSLLAVTMDRMGYHAAILDADITGPSIPKAFGLKEKAGGSELGIYPVKSGWASTSCPSTCSCRTTPTPSSGEGDHRRFRQAVLDGGHLDGRRFHVRRSAARNGRRALTVFQSSPSTASSSSPRRRSSCP